MLMVDYECYTFTMQHTTHTQTNKHEPCLFNKLKQKNGIKSGVPKGWVFDLSRTRDHFYTNRNKYCMAYAIHTCHVNKYRKRYYLCEHSFCIIYLFLLSLRCLTTCCVSFLSPSHPKNTTFIYGTAL